MTTDSSPGRHAAYVTGASRGIGRAIALALAGEGFDVAVGCRDGVAAAEAVVDEVRALGRAGLVVQADVSDPAGCAGSVERAADGLGGLDVVVGNAGALAAGPLLDVTPEAYDLQLDTNARGCFFLVQAAARRMIAGGRGGRIVLVTSDAATRAYAGLAAYCMSKAATRMLVHAAAHELAPHGITVNAVAPGTTETDLNREALADPAQRAVLLGSILLGRPGRPEDVGKAAAFIASEPSGFMTGGTIAVDGGAAIH
jgi:NAD(P)-dependent dehydrogenase (short-subunit alcohol dehydrogenase family)